MDDEALLSVNRLLQEVDELDVNDSLTTITLPLDWRALTSGFFSNLTNNVLKNPIFKNHVLKKKSNNQLRVMADSDNDTLFRVILPYTKESIEFFQAIGQSLDNLESLILADMILPLALFNHVFFQGEGEESSETISLPNLKKIHLEWINFTSKEEIGESITNNNLNVAYYHQMPDDEISPVNPVVLSNFVNSLQRLPNLESITTSRFIETYECIEWKYKYLGINAQIAEELVKLKFRNNGRQRRRGMVNVDQWDCLENFLQNKFPITGEDATPVTPEMIFANCAGGGGNNSGSSNSNHSSGDGTWIFTAHVKLAIEAVLHNTQLEHLEFLGVGEEQEIVPPFLRRNAPSFARALCNPSSGILDTVVIGGGHYHPAMFNTEDDLNNEDNDALSNELLLAALVVEIIKVLPLVKIRKLILCGFHPDAFHQYIEKLLTMERLGNNQCLEELSFYLLEGAHSKLFQLPDENIQLHLNLNKFHRQYLLKGGQSRDSFQPEAVSQQQWLDLHMALAEEGNVKLINYFYQLYPVLLPVK